MKKCSKARGSIFHRLLCTFHFVYDSDLPAPDWLPFKAPLLNSHVFAKQNSFSHKPLMLFK